jgi:hypothetical protein
MPDHTLQEDGQYAWRVTIEFDVWTQDPSPIDAAWQASEFLKAYDSDRGFYTVRRHDDERMQEHDVDLEEVADVDEVVESPKWERVREELLPDGRQAAWPYVVKKGNEYVRTNSGYGRIIRYSNGTTAGFIADSMNNHERNTR